MKAAEFLVALPIFIVLGVTEDSYKDILSITVGVNENSKIWLEMVNDLKRFLVDFKSVYNVPNEVATFSELESIKQKWENIRMLSATGKIIGKM